MRTVRHSRWARFLLAAGALALVSSACTDSGSNGDDGDAGSTELVDVYNLAGGPPDHIDPGLTGSLEGAQVTALLFDGLTAIDPASSQVVAWAADEFSANDAGDVWTFHLRDGVTFSDGSDVEPSDFAYAWQRAASEELASDVSYLFDVIADTDGELTGIEADDDASTLTVALDRPFFDFPAVVSHTAYSPVPEAAVAELEDPSSWEHGDLVGNGPYVLADAWEAGDGIRLERNDDYWGGPEGDREAVVDELELRASDDVQAAYTDFESGTGQLAAIPPGQFEAATEAYDSVVQAQLAIDLYVFNQEDPVVGGASNTLLRKAISLAIDRAAINTTAHEGAYVEASGVTPPGVVGYGEGLCTTCELDVERAEELYADWGGTLTEPLRLSYPASGAYDDEVTVIQANLAEIGIEVALDPVDAEVYYDEMSEPGGCQICLAGWGWDYPIYDGGISSLFLTDGEANLGHYSSERFDSLIEEARGTADADERAELYRQAEAIALDDQAVFVTGWPTSQLVYRDVTDVTMNSIGFVAYDEVRFTD